MLAGTNDWRLKNTIGDVGSNTGVPNTDPGTMCGAMGAILTYIYTHNPYVKIYICPSPQIRMLQNNVSEAMSYINASYNMAAYWGLPMLDIWHSGISGVVGGNYTEMLYDLTHPNYFGAKMLGETLINGLHGV